ncbi:hypothetical protein PHYPO_G00160820 [Pangasianodon hypophthalmus]|uniref:Integrase core domain-containing protein n=1 Tax=Pangasianodon hypophthalmus TaxID=310915 RepID=A0A5N5JT80_PANHP|nr:hypothetical protein PHYPO_G00160820 [Pangasianodon hypophthalmus]
MAEGSVSGTPTTSKGAWSGELTSFSIHCLNHKLIKSRIWNQQIITTQALLFQFFLKTAQNYGWPSRMKGDEGVEKVGITETMFTVKGTGRRSWQKMLSSHLY